MNVTPDIAALQSALIDERHSHKRIAFVPTMGHLHAGHLSLVTAGRSLADCVVASIFVNPLQFAANEDFGNYPRSLSSDLEQLQLAGADYVFVPTSDTIYPDVQTLFVEPPDLPMATTLEGEFRPEHFRGVLTVVAKLFHIVLPDFALFGKKDYQQWRLIESMARQLAFPITVIGKETVRDSDGLALSSRNAYLNDDERQQAPQLYQEITRLAERLRKQRLSPESIYELAAHAMNRLDVAGWCCDYLAVRRQDNLQAPLPTAGVVDVSLNPLVVLAAARLGKTRLIDSLEI